MAWHHTGDTSLSESKMAWFTDAYSLQWPFNERDGVSNYQRLHCLLNHLSRRRSNKASKFRVTGLCQMNTPVTGEFPAQRASNSVNASFWWRHHICVARSCRGVEIPLGDTRDVSIISYFINGSLRNFWWNLTEKLCTPTKLLPNRYIKQTLMISNLDPTND